MAKEFDVQILNKVVISVIEESLKKTCQIDLVQKPTGVEQDILEYNSRMRVFPMEKFNEPTYVAATNYYFSEKDLDNKKVAGTFILFIKEDIAVKLLRVFGSFSKETEDEDLILDVVGKFCDLLAAGVKNELVTLGYADLIISPPLKYKNNVPEGIPFDFSLFRKQEISVTLWDQKCVVVEVCISNIPRKDK